MEWTLGVFSVQSRILGARAGSAARRPENRRRETCRSSMGRAHRSVPARFSCDDVVADSAGRVHQSERGCLGPLVTIVPNRLLVAVPAYNEEASIESVVNAVRQEAPEFDLLVINDGARDATPEILRRLGVPTARHYCNLGYGRAVQTAIKYARRHGYTALVTFDGDGQHRATDLKRLRRTFVEGDYDLLIGSRFLQRRQYGSAGAARRLGLWLSSALLH